jgi:hypothetical protein
MPSKSHLTAIAVIPPEEVWGPIQAIREAHDRQVWRWPSHIIREEHKRLSSLGSQP